MQKGVAAVMDRWKHFCIANADGRAIGHGRGAWKNVNIILIEIPRRSLSSGRMSDHLDNRTALGTSQI